MAPPSDQRSRILRRGICCAFLILILMLLVVWLTIVFLRLVNTTSDSFQHFFQADNASPHTINFTQLHQVKRTFRAEENLWLQLANFSRMQVWNDSCYVCMRPKPRVWMVPLPYNSTCKASSTTICPFDCLLLRSNNHTWNSTAECPPLVFSGRSMFSMYMPPIPSGVQFECFSRKGKSSHNVGIFPGNCSSIIKLIAGVASIPADMPASQKLLHILMGNQTKPIPDVFWACGGEILRATLPVDWTGLCARVTLIEEITVIPEEQFRSWRTTKSTQPRRRRSPGFTKDHRIWIDAIGVPRGVPDEFKAVNQIAAGVESFFCQLCTINKNVDWINYIYFNQQRFVNYTGGALQALGEQMHATSMMAIQNRLALDMLLAKEGGVCAMFGDACCTFIPSNTSPDGSFSKAMSSLKTLAEELNDNAGHGMWNMDWFKGTFDKWRAFFTKLGIGLLIIVIVLFALGCCVFPLIRGLILKTVK